jgi:2-methylcitrate dehydratase PrpD
MKRSPIELGQLKQVIVRVGTHEASVVNNRDMPDICLQHMIALMLVDKTVTFRSAHDKARMQDPAILRERAKIELLPDKGLEGHMPQREAIVELISADGTQRSEHVLAVRGTVENPMIREELLAKCTDLIAPIMGQAACKNLIAQIFRLEGVKNIRELRSSLRPS